MNRRRVAWALTLIGVLALIVGVISAEGKVMSFGFVLAATGFVWMLSLKAQ